MPNPVIKAAIKLLEVLFAAGIIGSAIVVLLTAIEDLETMFSGNHEENTEPQQKKEVSVWPA